MSHSSEISMKQDFLITKAQLDDLPQIFEVFQNAIRQIAKDSYTIEQVDAWANTIYSRKNIWEQRIKNEAFIVAKIDEKIIGFAALKGFDYFDLLFVSPDFGRKGIASIMYDNLEAKIPKDTLLKTDASKLSLPLFQKKGFIHVSDNKVEILGVRFTNHHMSKQL
jgi:putative acetyltransferase